MVARPLLVRAVARSDELLRQLCRYVLEYDFDRVPGLVLAHPNEPASEVLAALLLLERVDGAIEVERALDCDNPLMLWVQITERGKRMLLELTREIQKETQTRVVEKLR